MGWQRSPPESFSYGYLACVYPGCLPITLSLTPRRWAAAKWKYASEFYAVCSPAKLLKMRQEIFTKEDQRC